MMWLDFVIKLRSFIFESSNLAFHIHFGKTVDYLLARRILALRSGKREDAGHARARVDFPLTSNTERRIEHKVRTGEIG